MSRGPWPLGIFWLRLEDTALRLKVSGHPASIRIAPR